MLQEQYKIFPEICEKNVKKMMFSPQNEGLIPNKLPNYSFFMPQLMLCGIITHSQLNSVLQEKYKIFPEICEKMSKICVFYPKIDSNI